MESTLMNPADEAVKFAQQLDSLGGYVTSLLDMEKDHRDLVFLWDHEMIIEIMYPWQTNSVYSGLLWLGLENLREASQLSAGGTWRIVIPEGTRVELERTLLRMADKYSSLLSKASSTDLASSVSSLDQALMEFKDRSEYHDVVATASQLQNLDHTVGRLILFLQRYARPIPFSLNSVDSSQIEYYRRKLERERKQATDLLRNEADALNLACAEMLPDEETSVVPALITATGAVLRRGKPWARDPMFFALSTHFKKQHPTLESRRRILQRMQVHIQDMVNRTEDLATSGSFRRHEVPEFLRALDALKSDPFFMEVAAFTAQARQAILTASAQAQTIAEEFTMLRMKHGGSPKVLIERLLGAFGESSPSSNSFRWTPADNITDEVGPLLSNGDTQVIEAALLPGGIALSWESMETLDDFFTEIGKFCSASRTAMRQVAFRYASRSGVSVEPVNDADDYRSVIKRQHADEKSTLIRVDTNHAKFWFDPGELHFEIELGKVATRRTKFAMHLYDGSIAELAAQFVCRTASIFIPMQPLSKVLSNALLSVK